MPRTELVSSSFCSIPCLYCFCCCLCSPCFSCCCCLTSFPGTFGAVVPETRCRVLPSCSFWGRAFCLCGAISTVFSSAHACSGALAAMAHSTDPAPRLTRQKSPCTAPAWCAPRGGGGAVLRRMLSCCCYWKKKQHSPSSVSSSLTLFLHSLLSP